MQAASLAGKVLVDVADAPVRKPDGSPGPLLYPQDSLGARLQQALPQILVAKTLNTLLFPVVENPAILKGASASETKIASEVQIAFEPACKRRSASAAIVRVN